MNITAIATPPGTGGIATIRISGPQAITIADHLFRPARPGKTLTTAPPYTLHYGTIFDPADHTDIDDVITSIYHAPHSFTGENTIEISCHGSPYIQQRILRLLIDNGCRMANPGEFTQRAFTNGRLDLSQAEAIADLISAHSATAHRIALNQMRGGISTRLEQLRRQLLHITTLVELELDFADHEELQFADRTQLRTLATDIHTNITTLLHTFATGTAIKNGIPIAIVGETNAGKSTLLNHLVGDDRAIVSDIPGTTRDTIEDTTIIHDHLFRFIDTAGIRHTDDIIERIGIERTYTMIERAQIILWVVDSTAVTEHIEWLADHILRHAGDKPVIIALNKIDRLTPDETHILRNLFSPYHTPIVEISAKHHHNTTLLLDTIYQATLPPPPDTTTPANPHTTHQPPTTPTQIDTTDTIITNARHYEALTHAEHSIRAVLTALDTDLPTDLITQDLRLTLHHLAEITGGAITTPEVLTNIFSHFCIGK